LKAAEAVKAFIRPRDDARLDPEQVRAWAAATLARFKVPSVVEFVDQPLPRNPSGKLLKQLLRTPSTS
jgi:acyl-CoA synthetase (AMP-forming)/AMP-acid ligase II